MKKIAIIDYSVGNVLSLTNALKYIGYNSVITNNIKLLEKSTHLILPGVGAFGFAMERIKNKKLDSFLKDRAKKKIPIMGICLGLQILFENSKEFGNTKGLGIIKGNVEKIVTKKNRTPITGWIKTENKKSRNQYFYYTHSYHCVPKNKKIITNYYRIDNKKIISGIEFENITGYQFHPEKSSNQGLQLLKNFVEK